MRTLVTIESEVEAFKAFEKAINEAKGEKGVHTFASKHEILGVLEEEYHELCKAIQDNDITEFEEELMDIMVASFWGICSLKNKSLDW